MKTYKVKQYDWSKLRPDTPEPKIKSWNHGRTFPKDRKLNLDALPVVCSDCKLECKSRSDLMSHRYAYH